MYTLAIHLYALCATIASLFSRKVRLMRRGQHAAWAVLREKLSGGDYYWFHAASLGEFEQGRPIMEHLRRDHPEAKILLTFFSPSGYEVRKNYEVADIVCYLPFDTPRNARRFVHLVHPKALYLIKYEFWRNYIDQLYRAEVPVYSVSSIFRDKQIFFRWYGRNYARCLKRIRHFFVQDDDSRRRLATLGIACVTVSGDTRFDRVLDIQRAARPLPLVEQFAQPAGSRILVAGSSWPADEDLIISYFNAHPELRLVLAPHVVNEDHLRSIEHKLARPSLRYSAATEANVADAHCLIIDCYGLLSSIYRYATVAYVGGGFGVGIHNVTEAAVYGCPVLIGPNNQKFREARQLIADGGCLEVTCQDDFDSTLSHLLSDDAALQRAGQAAGTYISKNAGAVDVICEATGI